MTTQHRVLPFLILVGIATGCRTRTEPEDEPVIEEVVAPVANAAVPPTVSLSRPQSSAFAALVEVLDVIPLHVEDDWHLLIESIHGYTRLSDADGSSATIELDVLVRAETDEAAAERCEKLAVALDEIASARPLGNVVDYERMVRSLERSTLASNVSREATLDPHAGGHRARITTLVRSTGAASMPTASTNPPTVSLVRSAAASDKAQIGPVRIDVSKSESTPPMALLRIQPNAEQLSLPQITSFFHGLDNSHHSVRITELNLERREQGWNMSAILSMPMPAE